MYLGCSEYTKTTRNHLVKCSGIEAAISGLYRCLGGHQQLEQDTHTWLDIVLNDKTLIKRPEEWEAIEKGWASYGRYVSVGTQSPERADGQRDMKRVAAQELKKEERQKRGEEGVKISN